MEYFSVVIGYLLGSIPFGLLAGFALGIDIRTVGSGNIGATNVVRACGWKIGLPVFALDVIKGVAPVLLAKMYFCPESGGLQIITGMAAILGHNFPVWLKFKGGKGVATSAGVVGALMWQPLLIALAAFFAIVLVTRYISLGSMVAGVVLVIARVLLTTEPFSENEWPLSALAILLCVMLIVRHRANIGRLLAGTESKIGAKKKEEAEATGAESGEPAETERTENV
ncbi:MAG: glycerol-3-phosphate 1-O-acyltransferase PlsY [Planctomycetes bacterium]|nr:glycerol-3-phosphate 1-O-acyltransferase PlsY [Planctomycetota bacterium]